MGTWLLFAGPLYQAALELLEQDVDRSGFAEAIEDVEPPRPVSSRWWLLPPVMLVLRRHRNEQYRRSVRAHLSAQQQAQFARLAQKALGWFIVAAGALFLAVDATYELSERLEWPNGVLAAVLVLMLTLSAGGTALGIARHGARD